jgi:cytoskeletal protein CcmA (bactofilin family)
MRGRSYNRRAAVRPGAEIVDVVSAAPGSSHLKVQEAHLMADAPNAQDFPTVIGPDAAFKGEMTFEKGLRLQGRFEGRITTTGRLHVAKEARMQADVESGGITIEGEVKGALIASDRIDMRATARYEGDLRASKLTVEEGAAFSGHVTVGPDAVKNRPPQQAAPAMPRPVSAPQAQPQPAVVR